MINKLIKLEYAVLFHLEIIKFLSEEPYHMNPVYLMSNFALGQIKAAIQIFPNVLYNECFFDWSQCI